jgi:RNA polymerase sigma factor (sigma-70 family)
MERMTERPDEEAMLRLVQDHAAELLRFARRFSLCADDAHDAYQRSLEILVRRLRTAPPDKPLPWLRTVIRHESLNVRREREQLLGRDEADLDLHAGREGEDPAERAEGAERLARLAEALQRLKPQEVTALVLRAEGLSYKEICSRQGWTYTKTNRCVTEGRRALRDRLGAIESGAECERWLPLLSALADGEATMRQRAELRPHLRVCSACRATLRDFRETPRQVAALVPVGLVPLVATDPTSVASQFATVVHALGERATFAAARFQGAIEALPGTKVAAVAASTAAIAGGGAVIEHAADAPAREAPPVARAVEAPAPTAAAPPIALRTRPAARTAPVTTAVDADAGGEFAPEAPSVAPAANAAPPPAAVTAQTPAPSPAPRRAEPPGEFAGP